MPFCDVNKNAELSGGIKIFYRRYGRGSTKVLLIIGLAGTHDSWGPQIKGLAGSIDPNDEEAIPIDGGEEDSGIEICSFDNRGMGRSSVPTKKSEYTTENMAKDALALLDHLGWEKAHVVGHSMGAMIAFKLAAVAPNRVRSLALLNVTGGGYECFPKINRQMLSLAYRFLRAKNPEQRAMVDLETHYTKEYLEEKVGSTTRRQILYQQYVRAISSTGMQSPYGFEGQVNACWTHRVTSNDIKAIRSSGFHVSVIHGRDDIIAQMCHAKKLSDKLHPVARMVELPGAHLVSHERTEEVNQSLMDLFKASESNVPSHVWSRSSKNEKGGLNLTVRLNAQTKICVRSADRLKHHFCSYITGRTLWHSTLSDRPSNGRGFCLETSAHLISKFQLSFLFFFGLFVMAFGYIVKILRPSKPVRVGETVS